MGCRWKVTGGGGAACRLGLFLVCNKARASACDVSVPLMPSCVQAPDCSLVGPGEKILLFRHQPTSEQLLLRLREGSRLQDGDLIEVVVAGGWDPF